MPNAGVSQVVPPVGISPGSPDPGSVPVARPKIPTAPGHAVRC